MFRSFFRFLSQLLFDPFRTFFHTYRVLARLRKESNQIAFSPEEQNQINERIQAKALEVLLERIHDYGVDIVQRNTDSKIRQALNEAILEKAVKGDDTKVKDIVQDLLANYLDRLDQTSINSKTKKSVDQFLNDELNKYACKPANEKLKIRKEELFLDYMASLSSDVINSQNKNKILELINQKGIKWVHESHNKQVQSKVEELHQEFVAGLDQSNISHNTQQAIVDFVNSAVKEISCKKENENVLEKSKKLSLGTLNSLDESSILPETLSAIQRHFNDILLSHSSESSNELIHDKVIEMLGELVARFNSAILTEKTIDDLKANLNDRAIEFARIKDNQSMIQKAEELLNLYLDECKVIDTMSQSSMSSIKQSLNKVILDLVESSERIGQEAKRLFHEILEHTNAENIDPIIKMKTEAALYKVIVKELAVYGNDEMVKKAVEFMHDISQRLPHESTTSDMIMSHKIRQIQYLK